MGGEKGGRERRKQAIEKTRTKLRGQNTLQADFNRTAPSPSTKSSSPDKKGTSVPSALSSSRKEHKKYLDSLPFSVESCVDVKYGGNRNNQ